MLQLVTYLDYNCNGSAYMLNRKGPPSMHFKAQVQISKILLRFTPQCLGWNCPVFSDMQETIYWSRSGYSGTGVYIYFTFDLTIKGRTLISLSQWFKGLQTEAFRFLVSKVLSGGNSMVKKETAHEINAKSCKVDIWILGYFCRWECSGTNVFPKPQNDARKLFTPSVLGASGGNF